MSAQRRLAECGFCKNGVDSSSLRLIECPYCGDGLSAHNLDAIATETIWGMGFRSVNDGSWHRWPAWVVSRAARRPWIIPTWRVADANPWPHVRLIGRSVARTGVRTRWLGRWGRDGAQSEREGM